MALRVVFARNPPDAFSNCMSFPTFSPTINCLFPGWCVEIVKMIADSLHLDIHPVIVNNAIGSLNWGTLQNNDSWTGVLGFLANNTADTACLFYQSTDLRERYFELSYPVTNIQPVYVVRRHKTTIGSVLWSAFKPYSTMTWLAILASLILQLLLMVFISYVEVKMEKRPHFRPFEAFNPQEKLVTFGCCNSGKVRECFGNAKDATLSMAWQVLQLQLDEKSENMVFYTFSGNGALFLFSLLQSAFFVYLYEGLLLSALIQQKEENPLKDADGVINLIAEGKYRLVTNYRGNWYFDEMDNSNISHFARLRAATSSNPVVVAGSVSEALDLVEKGNYIFPIQEDSLAMQMSRERCNLVYVNRGQPQRSAHLIFANNSQFLKKFNTEIIMQSRFVQRTFRKYFTEGFKLANIPKCPVTEYEEGSKSLDVNSMIGIFAVGAIGMSFAFVAFVAEVRIAKNWQATKMYCHHLAYAFQYNRCVDALILRTFSLLTPIIYHFWHKNVLMRKWTANAPLGGVQNILAVAKIYFNTSNNDQSTVMKLAEHRQKIVKGDQICIETSTF